MDWQDKTVTILGLGRSGLACAKELSARGCRLILSDTRPTAELLPLVQGLGLGDVRVEGGGHSGACLDADVIIMSPGVTVELPIVQAALADGVPVLGELELAFRLRPGISYIGITGTNGKTTTTTLVSHILAEAGRVAVVGGNIGTPLVSLVHQPADVVIAEISSFQLETIERFHPHVGVLLNFSDDHLNRHGTREAYWRAKARIFENQGATDWAVLNVDDPQVASLVGQTPGRSLPFSGTRRLERGVWVEDHWVVAATDGHATPVMPVAEVQLRGHHNLENVLAAVGVAVALGLEVGPVRRAVGAFTGVEHRIEPVRTLGGVTWYNDSKGTNYDATIKAIEAFDEGVVLLAGGRDKGGDMQALLACIRHRVRQVVLLGESAPALARALRAAGYEACTVVDSLAAAVAEAHRLAAAGEVVLFSPACTSFDMFKDYEDRGRAFKALVRALDGGEGEPAAQG
ncbi:MAG: UDP-N-acetylmuramoyl-L-alanine--D-glutamate ligase [Candidatus Sericytochromatia bacterium]|nr:UDP-N-acetylmuramoyl-L-alanine--D-glutamate ligase [Candidatus Sericytochromatia bacterium]